MNNSVNNHRGKDRSFELSLLSSAIVFIKELFGCTGEFNQAQWVDVLCDIEPGENILDRLKSAGHECYPKGCLSIGLPGRTESNEDMDHRLFWIPGEIDLEELSRRISDSSLHIASSRIGRDYDNLGSWFDAIRTVAIHAKNGGKTILTSPKVTCHRFVARLSELMNVPQINFLPIVPGIDLGSAEGSNIDARRSVIFTTPPLDADVPGEFNFDELLSVVSNQLHVLKVRRNGNVHKNIQLRLDEGRLVHLLIDEKLTSAKLTRELIDSGVIGNWLYKSENIDSNSNPPNSNITLLSDMDQSKFLIHWTRGRSQSLPSQTEQEFLDDLLFGQAIPETNSALVNLCRILVSQTLLGSNLLTRSDIPLVCLSAIELVNLKQLQRFQPHLARWDALPYGIAIDRDLLIELGARPVIYGHSNEWDGLAVDDQPFFQLKSATKNWEQEQEFRILHSLDLARIPIDKAWVFVPNQEEAIMVSRISKWPVVVMHAPSTS